MRYIRWKCIDRILTTQVPSSVALMNSANLWTSFWERVWFPKTITLTGSTVFSLTGWVNEQLVLETCVANNGLLLRWSQVWTLWILILSPTFHHCCGYQIDVWRTLISLCFVLMHYERCVPALVYLWKKLMNGTRK
jgi:hypothetical protein